MAQSVRGPVLAARLFIFKGFVRIMKDLETLPFALGRNMSDLDRPLKYQPLGAGGNGRHCCANVFLVRWCFWF